LKVGNLIVQLHCFRHSSLTVEELFIVFLYCSGKNDATYRAFYLTDCWWPWKRLGWLLWKSIPNL